MAGVFIEDVFSSTLAADAGRKTASQLSGLYLGAMIIFICAVLITPIELFLVEIWPRQGFFSLLLVVAPLIAGCVFARILPESYYRIKPWEESGGLYEKLGIRFFKRFVPDGDYVNRRIRHSDPGYRVVCDQESIVRFAERTRLAEKCHLAGLWLPLPCTVYALLLGWNTFALWLLLPSVPLHVYPVLLQRYSRTRIQRILKREKARRSSKT